MSVQGRAVPLVHSTTRPLALGGRLLLLGDVSACTPACRLTQQPAGPHGLSRLLLLTAAVPPSLTRARTRGHAAAGALPVAPLPMLPSTAMLTRGEAHACLSAPDCPPPRPLAPSSAGKRLHAALRAVGCHPAGAHRDGAPRGSLLPPLHPEAKGQSSSPQRMARPSGLPGVLLGRSLQTEEEAGLP